MAWRIGGTEFVAAASLAMAIASCGGKAIIDPGGGGGTGSSTNQGGSPVCVTPAPVGPLTPCGGTIAPDQCSAMLCDEAGNSWESSCRPSGCACMYNGQLRCSCVTEGFGHACDGVTTLCCPPPFPKSLL